MKGVERTFAMFSLQRTTSGSPSPSRSGERGQGSHCQSGPLPQRISVSERGRESHPANAKIMTRVRCLILILTVRGLFKYYKNLWLTRSGSSATPSV